LLPLSQPVGSGGGSSLTAAPQSTGPPAAAGRDNNNSTSSDVPSSAELWPYDTEELSNAYSLLKPRVVGASPPQSLLQQASEHTVANANIDASMAALASALQRQQLERVATAQQVTQCSGCPYQPAFLLIFLFPFNSHHNCSFWK
jgi:hypothetical protein